MNLYEINMTVGNATYSCGRRTAAIPALIAGALLDGVETITIKRVTKCQNEIGENMELPRYQSHKTVWAAKITEMISLDSGTQLLFGEIDKYIIVTKDWMSKHSPTVGGYFVRYADDYTSFSPAEAFENGYTRV